MPRFPAHPDRRPAVVTGASSGIGAATARALAQLGHPVALGARRVKECEELAAELRVAGAEAVAIHLDLSDDDSTGAFCERATAELGYIEIRASNAPNNAASAVLATLPEDFERTLKVNLAGAHRLVTLLGAGMVKRQRGDLVFVSSDVVNDPRPAMSAYVASKAGLEGYVRTLRMELEG